MNKKVLYLFIVLSIFLCGCKFSIKEYASSIGELKAETTNVE